MLGQNITQTDRASAFISQKFYTVSEINGVFGQKCQFFHPVYLAPMLGVSV